MTLHDAGLLFMLGMFAILWGLLGYFVWKITGNIKAILRKASEK